MIDKQTIKTLKNITLFKLNGVNENTKFLGRKVLKWIQVSEKSKSELVRNVILNALKKAGILLEYKTGHNLITTAGRTVIARLTAGDATYSGEINYGALGTDSTTATNGDTTLGTEVYRKVQYSQSYSGAVCYVDFFYSATDWDGTAEEFGNFIDGEAGADTGQMFSHLITGGWVKSATESLFVSCQYTYA